MADKNRLERLKARRKVWLEVHVWLGLGLGLFLAIIGLTGSVLVFWHEIDEAINPTLYEAPASKDIARKPMDGLLAAAIQSAPPNWSSIWLDAPQAHGNYVFGFYYPEGGSPSPEQAESLNVAINPFTGHVVTQRVFYHAWNPLKHCLVGFFFKLHYAFFLGGIGVTLVGVLAIFFFVSVMSGLILWWPLTGNWKRVLSIKRKASPERFNHDLHQTTGFYSLLVLLALFISGIYFNLPDQFRWLVEHCSPLTAEPVVHAAQNGQVAPLETAFAKAQALYAGSEPQFYTFSGGENKAVTACFHHIPALRRYVLDSGCAVIDPNTGEILQLKDPAHGSAGDVFMQWQWPLHSGQAFGWTGRILVFVTGLLCPVLFVTGVIRWLQKRRVKQLKPQRGLGKPPTQLHF